MRPITVKDLMEALVEFEPEATAMVSLGFDEEKGVFRAVPLGNVSGTGAAVILSPSGIDIPVGAEVECYVPAEAVDDPS